MASAKGSDRRSDYEIHAVINDIHVPYHNSSVVYAFLDWCKDIKPDVIHIAGDFIDFPQISKFDKDPDRILELQKDLDEGIILLWDIKKANPCAEIIFHEGNHEDRLNKYKWKNPELHKLRALTVQSLLELDRFCSSYHRINNPYIWKNTFVIYHGNVVRKHGSYSAKAELESFGMSGISGHTHRGGCHYKTDRGGEKVWYENFCMCEKDKVDYMKGKPNWQHGFSVIFFKKKSKRFYVQQIPIINSGFIYGSKHYGK